MQGTSLFVSESVGTTSRINLQLSLYSCEVSSQVTSGQVTVCVPAADQCCHGAIPTKAALVLVGLPQLRLVPGVNFRLTSLGYYF